MSWQERVLILLSLEFLPPEDKDTDAHERIPLLAISDYARNFPPFKHVSIPSNVQ